MSDILERIYNIYYLYNKKAVIPTITGNEKPQNTEVKNHKILK